MFWFFYNLVFHAVYILMLPHFLLRMRRRGGYRQDFFQRLFRLSEADLRRVSEGRKLWIHAVSVGEVSVGLAFMNIWRERHPEVEFLLTVNTSTGHAIAKVKLGPQDVLLYPPVDSPWVVRKLLKAVDVEAMVLVETEMWPNLLRQLHRRNIPVMLLNGRVSDRSYRRLEKVPFYTQRLYPLVSLYAMQSREDAERVIGLGAPEERVKVMHSSKYDVVQRNPVEEAARRSRLIQSGFMTEDSILLLGSSTWPGEEKVLMQVYLKLRAEFPGLRLILVPRHFERSKEVLQDTTLLRLKAVCWSDFSKESAKEADLLIVDTTGELVHFTGIADRVFVGKSLFRCEGQNPIEAANAGKFLVTGPGMDNFRQVIGELRNADAVKTAADEESLYQVLRESLRNPGLANEQGERAERLVSERKGSLERTVRGLEGLTASHTDS
ncbi:MAG: glycosyltransferase N-terminal domain-containing protein [Kiritimatiellia bacterium]